MTSKHPPGDARARRLAEALRANLKKRKELRRAPAAPDEPGDDPSNPRDRL